MRSACGSQSTQPKSTSTHPHTICITLCNLSAIAKLTNSEYTHVGAGKAGTLRTKMASYYADKRLQQPTGSDPLSDIVLSVPYEDSSGLGLVTTLVREG